MNITQRLDKKTVLQVALKITISKGSFMEEKKVWYIGIHRRLWVPVSIEGWLIMLGCFGSIWLLGQLHGVFNGSQPPFSQIVFFLLEFLVISSVVFYFTKDHVDRRY